MDFNTDAVVAASTDATTEPEHDHWERTHNMATREGIRRILGAPEMLSPEHYRS